VLVETDIIVVALVVVAFIIIAFAFVVVALVAITFVVVAFFVVAFIIVHCRPSNHLRKEVHTKEKKTHTSAHTATKRKKARERVLKDLPLHSS